MNNPIIRAAKAAYVELTTPEAIQWYQATATQAYLVAATLITLAVCLVEDWLLCPQEYPATVPALEPLALPHTPIAGLLMPARPVPLVTPSVLPSEHRVLVTPAGGEGLKSVAVPAKKRGRAKKQA